MAGPVLYIVAFAAEPVLRVAELVAASQGEGWDACLILSPTAARWLEADLPALRELTGHPVRSSYKLPGEPDVLPPAEAVLAAPVTSNSINKWAGGISDTLALGIITEAIGKRLPIAAAPCLNLEQERHGAYARSVEFLRDSGVAVVLGDDGHALRATGDRYPWPRVLAAVQRP